MNLTITTTTIKKITKNFHKNVLFFISRRMTNISLIFKFLSTINEFLSFIFIQKMKNRTYILSIMNLIVLKQQRLSMRFSVVSNLKKKTFINDIFNRHKKKRFYL